MKAVWKRIHAWLDENAPKGYGQLRDGANAEAIQEAEKAMGLKLPTDVKASYRVHDGQTNEPGLIGGEGWCLLSLQEMVKSWRKWCKPNPRYERCVPVAYGGAGDIIFLDLNLKTEKQGRVIVQRSDTEKPDFVAVSFHAWLEAFASQLEDDEFVFSEADGCLMYADELD